MTVIKSTHEALDKENVHNIISFPYKVFNS